MNISRETRNIFFIKSGMLVGALVGVAAALPAALVTADWDSDEVLGDVGSGAPARRRGRGAAGPCAVRARARLGEQGKIFEKSPEEESSEKKFERRRETMSKALFSCKYCDRTHKFFEIWKPRYGDGCSFI